MADMLTLGFYFLLRPGEYAQTANPEVPWHCFAPMLIQIGYGYLVAGDLTKCSDIFMYKRTLS
jgi:hypothetical protein